MPRGERDAGATPEAPRRSEKTAPAKIHHLEPPTKTYLWLRWRDLPAALAPVRASILLNMVAMFVFVL